MRISQFLTVSQFLTGMPGVVCIPIIIKSAHMLMPSWNIVLRPSHAGVQSLQSLAVSGRARCSTVCQCCSRKGPAQSRREVILQSVNLALLGEASIGTDDAKTIVNSILGAPCP